MNIFKVLASGRKSFPEELASAVLAWFLNPRMEHGLGYQFIWEFISELAKSDATLMGIKKELVLRLRSEHDKEVKFNCLLECPVGTAFIDIVLGIENSSNAGDKWIISIENKIYGTSVTSGQLQREYDGLREKFKKGIIAMVYLVPTDEDLGSKEEFDRLTVSGQDKRVLMSWQKSSGRPSVATAIHNILASEASGTIDPIPEYTRHTLKALLSFIQNDFSGYEYERETSRSILNPLTEGEYGIDELSKKENGFVGIQHGISGLLRLSLGELKARKFQFTQKLMESRQNWFKLEDFKKLIAWKLESKVPDILWDNRFPFDVIEKIAQDFKDKVFVGIRGGMERLKELGWEEIKNRQWEINSKQKSKEWIPGNEFLQIVLRKNQNK